jgi:hypothetical protein
MAQSRVSGVVTAPIRSSPAFRPVTTDVKAQKRFISTIARRLDTLGAITRGQRQTGGQNMFRPEDNLDSWYARDALRQLYVLLARGKVEGCSLARFEAATGLSLLDSEGLKDELPGINTFLNRMLALTVAMQNLLFEAFEGLLTARIEQAKASGSYEIGLETLQAESFRIVSRKVIYTHPGTGAQTSLLTIERKDRLTPLSRGALAMAEGRGGKLLVNARTGRGAIQRRARSVTDDDGVVHPRMRLDLAADRPGHTGRHAGREPVGGNRSGDVQRRMGAELAELPTHETSTLHMVAGLLPIWKQLPMNRPVSIGSRAMMASA